VITAVLAFLLSLGVPLSCSQVSQTPVRVGIDTSIANSLIITALKKGYFQEQGLEVTLHSFPSGLKAVEALLAGEVDVVTASEFVLATKAFQGEEIQAIASIATIRHIHICGRKDSGIDTPADLSGKRIGLTLGTAAEFFLGYFLNLYGLKITDVYPVNVNPQDSATALASGEVDAVVVWQPQALAVERMLIDIIEVWPTQNDRPLSALAISRRETIQTYPSLVEKYLRALLKAAPFCTDSPESVKNQTAEYLGINMADMETFWPDYVFVLKLDQGLILALEDEARWMIGNSITSRQKIPDFLDYIHTSGLKKVKPEAVSIIKGRDGP
jgi:NitT/TauT family transport system substrate-binding protein